MTIPGRKYNPAEYDHGFMGMEKDDEIKGSGNHYTTEFREYDPRVGRWWSVDPVTHAQYSPYSAFDNNPIYYIDPEGADSHNEDKKDLSDEKPKTETTETKEVVNKDADKKDVKDLTTSQKGIDFIKGYEKLKLKLYDDATDNATIGYGHLVHTGKIGTNTAKEKGFKDGITETKAEELLKSDIKDKAEKFIKDNVTVKLTQNQFDALSAFTFNVGGGSLKSSTLLKKVNADDTDAAIRTQFKAWNKGTVKGKKVELKGLTKRRGQEADIYIKNVYDSTH